MDYTYLETKRLKLRLVTPEVYDYVFQQLSQMEQLRFFGFSYFKELEKETAKYEKGIATHNRSFLYFQIISKQTDKIIGWCGYHTWYTDHRRAEIGYGITVESMKGKGLMSEAIAPIIQYGFEKMQLHRIEAFIGPDNTPSLKLVEKLGFTKEGHLRQHFCKDEIMEDSVVLSLLKQEYENS